MSNSSLETIEFTNLEIRILGRQEKGYPVEITVNHQRQDVKGFLSTDLLPWVPSASPQEDGIRLFEALFAEPSLQQAWAELRGKYPRRRILLHLDDTVSELYLLPWEMMIDSILSETTHPLASDSKTPFSRYLAGYGPSNEIISERPIKMLVVIASPYNLTDYEGLAPLDFELERSIIESATTNLVPEHLTVTVLPQPATLKAIEDELRKGHHLFHLVAHGRFSQRSQKNVFYLSDENNQVELIDDKDFIGMIDRLDQQPVLTFLAACQSGKQSSADTFRGLAPSLIGVGVSAVLAMQDFISVDTSRSFTRTFYRQLFTHGQVDLASNEARATVITTDLPDSNIPILFSRLPDNKLLSPSNISEMTAIEHNSPEVEAPYGAMRSDSAFYIKRTGDDHCMSYLSQPQATVSILAPRKMGKSSLIQQAILHPPVKSRYIVANIDFRRFDEADFEDGEAFLIQLCLQIGHVLRIPEAIDRYWTGRLANVTKCSDYLSEYIIPQLPRPLLLVLDAAEQVLDTSFYNDFFGMLRAWHDERVYNENFAQLGLLISCSTEPNHFIDDYQSPFNVGAKISLEDFTPTEIAELNDRHQPQLTPVQLQDLINLLSGHPFLTRLALYLMATGNLDFSTLKEQAIEDNGPFTDHLRPLLRGILDNSVLEEALRYILQYRTHPDDQTFHRLKGMGVVTRKDGQVLFRNRLYERYFEDRLNDK
ncbi:MAG: AAA-like domain-containing protein [Chloroflexota bacterium]